MAAGDVSREQATLIREFIGDNDYQIIPNDFIIYDKLTNYQQKWMVEKKIAEHTYEITLIAGTTSYALNSRLFQIIDIFVNEETGNQSIAGRYDEYTHSLIISSEFNNGDKVYVKGYLKPAFTEVDSVKNYDTIDETHDPLIDRAYFNLLRQAVLSDYSAIIKGIRSLESVEEQVEKLANELRQTAMFNPGNSPLRSVFY